MELLNIHDCVEFLNIHDCKHRSIDGCINTMSSIDIDLQMYFRTPSLRHLYSENGNAYLSDDYMYCIVTFG